MNERSARLLSDLINSNRTIEHLGLSNTSLSDASCCLIMACIPASKISSLDLSSNPLGPPSAVALSTALCHSSGCPLRTVLLGNTWIGCEGAAALSKALPFPQCRLRRLDLHACRIGEAGASQLAAAVQTAPPFIEWSSCDKGGAVEFRRAHRLEHLNVANNLFKPSILVDAIQHSGWLMHVDIDIDTNNLESWVNLKETLARNGKILQKVSHAALVLLSIRWCRRRVLDGFPKPVVKMIALELLKTRGQAEVWIH